MDEKREGAVSSEALLDAALLRRKMDELSLGESLKLPSADVLLPPTQKSASQDEQTQGFLAFPFYKEIAKAFDESLKPRGNYAGLSPSLHVSTDILKKEKVEVDPATELVLIRLKSTQEEKNWGEQREGNLRIKGPLARRELAYVPPIPKVKAANETELELKFWVRPNGMVDRVIPLKQAGDLELERVATNYLREWQFKPIPKNERQIDEWGTVTIEFRLE